ncbi:hypothetical protein OG474_27770 [Kribbella sp. NBC_01505]|uniref:hypothetical protein n=1 Tax=Kribbella sp. NBC_01505 TaxID=2903580 RepID=UPI00386C5A47
MNEGMYRLVMFVVAFLGIWEGIVALIFRLWTDKGPSVLTAANYLDAPWCYVVAAGTIVVAFILLAVLEQGRARAEA